MQRSRRARRGLEKTSSTATNRSFYTFFLSLPFLLWMGKHGNAPTTDDAISSIWNESKYANYKHSQTIIKNCSVAPFKDRFIDDNAISIRVFDDDNDIFAHEQKVNDVNLDVKKDGLGGNFQSDSLEDHRLSHVLPLGLEVFKSRAFISKTKTGPGQVLESSSIQHRHQLEPSGVEYNYAAASKGSKVLGFNKEAKGASNVLERDTDKYLRNPCSAHQKFIILELSEETLVRTIKIANFEHHSSNLKEFVLLGSSVYPTDVWGVWLGSFSAANAKHAQRFVLEEPKWARYLKLRLLSHHGSEFYCTLSVFEVYGVDAVEEMLEELVSVQDNTFISADNEPMGNHKYDGDDADIVLQDSVKQELRRHEAGRMRGDTVLKIVMHKVRSSDLNLSILERYLEELNYKYGKILRQFSDGIRDNDLLLERSREDMRNLLRSQKSVGKDVSDLISWRSLVSLQLDNLYRDNAMLRSEIEKVQEKQNSIENQGTALVFVCMIFLLFGLTRLFVDIAVSVYTRTIMEMKSKSGKFFMNTSWIFFLLSCSFFIFILI